MDSLERGKGELLRDSKVLREDQLKMRDLTSKLEKLVKLLQLVDKKLSERVSQVTDEEKRKFVKEELIFELRQTTMDRQQQLAVTQQEILTYEIIIRNNRELIRGVDRANDVTIGALQMAVATALALTNQRILVDKITAVNTTTSRLIERNAERLRTQGAEIHKQASQTMIEMDKLKAAFVNIHEAMEDISRFRAEALPQMANTILELDRLTTDAEKTIQKMERGGQITPSVAIDVK